jgi:hypothetical protein
VGRASPALRCGDAAGGPGGDGGVEDVVDGGGGSGWSEVVVENDSGFGEQAASADRPVPGALALGERAAGSVAKLTSG